MSRKTEKIRCKRSVSSSHLLKSRIDLSEIIHEVINPVVHVLAVHISTTKVSRYRCWIQFEIRVSSISKLAYTFEATSIGSLHDCRLQRLDIVKRCTGTVCICAHEYANIPSRFTGKLSSRFSG